MKFKISHNSKEICSLNLKIDNELTMAKFTEKVSAAVKEKNEEFKNKKIAIWEIDGAKGAGNDSDVPVADILGNTHSSKVIPIEIQTKE